MLRRTMRSYVVLAPIVLVAMLVRAVALYDGEALGLVPFAAVAAALLLGCFVHAGLTARRSDGWMDMLAWCVAGAVSLPTMVALMFLVLPTDVGDQALLRSLAFWAFWAAGGGLTGFAYWMIAQGGR